MARVPVNISNKIADIAPHKPPKISIKTVGPEITCHLCMGYLIDATTIVECLHSFCRSCILKHLRSEHYCPRCEMMMPQLKPKIVRDATLQAIVYKLVPGLYEKELLRRRAFYKERPNDASLTTPDQRGDDTEHLIFGPTENISLSLEYSDIEDIGDSAEEEQLKRPKYLQCPAVFTVSHMKKFVLNKFSIDDNQFCVEIMYKVKTIVLPDHYTLMDVAYIYTWKRDAPMRFFYRVRTNEMTIEELPEVPLRRSPSMSDRTSSPKANTIDDSKIVQSTLPPATVASVNNNDTTITVAINSITPPTNTSITNKEAFTTSINSVTNNSTTESTVNSETCSKTLSDSTTTLISTTISETTPLSANKVISTTSSNSTTTLTNTNSNRTSTNNVTIDKNSHIFIKPQQPMNKSDSHSSSEPSKSVAPVTNNSYTKKSEEQKKIISNISKPLKVKQSKSDKSDKIELKSKSVKKLKDDVPEKRVENIKLKIEQNSVTIVKTSTKELKKKLRKEREMKESGKYTASASGSLNNNSGRQKSDICDKKKQDIASIKLAKITQKSDTKSSEVKYEIKSASDLTAKPTNNMRSQLKIKIESATCKNELLDIDERKSEFLNSFNLTPTKSLSPEKLQQLDAQNKTNQATCKPPNDIKLSSPEKLLKSESQSEQKATAISSSIKTMADQKNSTTETKPADGTVQQVLSENRTNLVTTLPGNGNKQSIFMEDKTIDNKKLTDTKSPSDETKKGIDLKSVFNPPIETKASAINLVDESKVYIPMKRKMKEQVMNMSKKCRSSSPSLECKSALKSELMKKSKTPPLDKKMYGPPNISAAPVNVFPARVDLLIAPKPALKKPESSEKKVSTNLSSTTKSEAVSKMAQSVQQINASTPGSDIKSISLAPIHNFDKLPKPISIKRPDPVKSDRRNLSVKPMDKLMPQPLIVNNIQRPEQSDTPRPNTAKSLRNTSHSNGTKKLSMILPKPSNSATHCMIPIASMLRNPDTEIKQITNDGTNKDIKIYGPTMDMLPMAIKPLGSSSPAYVPSYPSISMKSNMGGSGYLNYALMNSHKRSNEMPLGMKSPIYAPQNSTSYSPNSPQFPPCYTIPPYPQYKYMKSPAYTPNYYQGPSSRPGSTKEDDTKKNKNDQRQQSLKRNNSNANKPNNDLFSPPVKQQKVQSLLDSCNISFPSSLSITLHEENDPASINPLFHPKRKSPVNNYIEIVKLPEVSITEEKVPLSSKPTHEMQKPNNLPVAGNIGKRKSSDADKQNTSKNKSPDKKIVPELNPIDKAVAAAKFAQNQMLQEKASFQEKFLQSIRNSDAAAEESKNSSSKSLTQKPIVSQDDSGKTKRSPPLINYRRSSISMRPTASINVPILPAPPSNNNALRQLLKNDTKARITPTSTTSPTSTSINTKQNSPDTALNLTASAESAACVSSSAATRLSPNNNNDMPKLSIETPDMSALIAAAAMARAAQNSSFLMPNLVHNMGFGNLQHMQQSYIMDHIARMQKAGQNQLNEAMESFKHNLKSNKANGAL